MCHRGSLRQQNTLLQATPKQRLLQLLQDAPVVDPILADPVTKEPLQIKRSSTLFTEGRQSFALTSSTNTYTGTSDTYLNLLPPSNTTTSSLPSFVPSSNYIPMRDLFTNPAVSFAYERGWRQGFARAGFPGPDQEFQLACDYFGPNIDTVVDMSCATGLFTRRFAQKYPRVFGCDYSDSMLTEARRQSSSSGSTNQKLTWIRCDVGQLPMQSHSVPALHAGAAMHCWPELVQGLSEIYRVLQPSGRYFATTFLSSYFGRLQQAGGTSNQVSTQAFQYFGSVEELRDLCVAGGFARHLVDIEVLGNACVVIRCEKEAASILE